MADPGRHQTTPSRSAHPEDDDPSALLLDRLAHDLRGPLSPLQTAAYLLRRDDIDAARQHELLEIIERQIARLSGMVQEVSDWTRARQSRLLDHRETTGVSMLVELACATAVPAVRLELPESLDHAAVEGDTKRLVQMLSTLVGIMQARAGDAGVLVRAEQTGGEVRVVVEAPGASWSHDEREALFRKAQAVPFDEGLGMRLLVARAIAQAHGGELGASGSIGNAWLEARLPLSS